MKKLLMIAFHYPPYAGGTGIHRTLKFTRYLPDFGWQPIVLTADPRAYPRRDENPQTPAGVSVTRAFALDTVRHLSLAGSHLEWMALPDRWISWWPAAVMRGMSLIKRHRPDVIWSTSPIATAHAIALTLQRYSSLPWIADFRDPMVSEDAMKGEGEAHDRLTQKARAWIERRSIQRCTRAVVTTPGTRSLYISRYPAIPPERWTVIANGYDEEDFEGASEYEPAAGTKPFVLIHSGDLYRGEGSGRDPMPLFKALAMLRSAGKISADSVRVILRATSDDAYYRDATNGLGLEQIVRIEPPIPHKAAVKEIRSAEGLLLLQGAKFNRQIPAKTYEYLRSGRPIFAIIDPSGDTAALLRSEGLDSLALPDSVEDIAERLMAFIGTVRSGAAGLARPVEHHSRRARTQELAELLLATARR